MKQLLIIILFSTAIFAQTGKSVLTQAQKDSIGAMISDSIDTVPTETEIGEQIQDSLETFDDTLLNLYRIYSLSLIAPSIGTVAVFDYVQDNIYIDSVYAVVKDSTIIFNIDTCGTISGTFNSLFAGNITADENTSGEYFTPASPLYIPQNTFMRIAVKNMYGGQDEDLFIKIYYRK